MVKRAILIILQLPSLLSERQLVFTLVLQTDALQGTSALHMEGSEAIVISRSYSDSLIFLLIHLFSTKVE